MLKNYVFIQKYKNYNILKHNQLYCISINNIIEYDYFTSITEVKSFIDSL